MDLTTDYLELRFIFLNINSEIDESRQKLMKKVILTDILLLQIKDKKHKKNLVVHLIQVKKVMMQIMKLVECKHLLLSLKTDN